MNPSPTKRTSQNKEQEFVATAKWGVLVLAVLAAFNVWPIFKYRYLPFMDHPSHLLQANILAHLHSATFGYDRFFKINLLPAPNLLNDYLTALLAQFVSIDAASHFMVALAMVALPLSVWFFLRTTRPGTEYWALFSIPMTWSRFLFFGNENFCLAVPLFFLFLTLIVSGFGFASWKKNAVMVFLATAIYFSHFLVFAVAGLAMVLHFVCGKKDIRNALLHAIPVLPGSILVLAWMIIKGPGGVTQKWEFNLLERIQTLVEGVCPVPWSVQGSIVWQCFCGSLLLFFIIRSVRLFSAPQMRFPVLLIGCCWVLAFCFQRWTYIFIPDQRMWWMSFLMALVLLPRPSKSTLLCLGIFGLPLALSASFATVPFFSESEKQLSSLEKAFATFPKGLRLLYFGDPRLPNQLHRAFEYYHVRYGGYDTRGLIGLDHSITLKENVFAGPQGEAFGIYGFNATQWIPYLDKFEGALIISDPSQASEAIITTLQSHGYTPVVTGPVTLLLNSARATN